MYSPHQDQESSKDSTNSTPGQNDQTTPIKSNPKITIGASTTVGQDTIFGQDSRARTPKETFKPKDGSLTKKNSFEVASEGNAPIDWKIEDGHFGNSASIGGEKLYEEKLTDEITGWVSGPELSFHFGRVFARARASFFTAAADLDKHVCVNEKIYKITTTGLINAGVGYGVGIHLPKLKNPKSASIMKAGLETGLVGGYISLEENVQADHLCADKPFIALINKEEYESQTPQDSDHTFSLSEKNKPHFPFGLPMMDISSQSHMTNPKVVTSTTSSDDPIDWTQHCLTAPSHDWQCWTITAGIKSIEAGFNEIMRTPLLSEEYSSFRLKLNNGFIPLKSNIPEYYAITTIPSFTGPWQRLDDGYHSSSMDIPLQILYHTIKEQENSFEKTTSDNLSFLSFSQPTQNLEVLKEEIILEALPRKNGLPTVLGKASFVNGDLVFEKSAHFPKMNKEKFSTKVKEKNGLLSISPISPENRAGLGKYMAENFAKKTSEHMHSTSEKDFLSDFPSMAKDQDKFIANEFLRSKVQIVRGTANTLSYIAHNLGVNEEAVSTIQQIGQVFSEGMSAIGMIGSITTGGGALAFLSASSGVISGLNKLFGKRKQQTNPLALVIPILRDLHREMHKMNQQVDAIGNKLDRHQRHTLQTINELFLDGVYTRDKVAQVMGKIEALQNQLVHSFRRIDSHLTELQNNLTNQERRELASILKKQIGNLSYEYQRKNFRTYIKEIREFALLDSQEPVVLLCHDDDFARQLPNEYRFCLQTLIEQLQSLTQGQFLLDIQIQLSQIYNIPMLLSGADLQLLLTEIQYKLNESVSEKRITHRHLEELQVYANQLGAMVKLHRALSEPKLLNKVVSTVQDKLQVLQKTLHERAHQELTAVVNSNLSSNKRIYQDAVKRQLQNFYQYQFSKIETRYPCDQSLCPHFFDEDVNWSRWGYQGNYVAGRKPHWFFCYEHDYSRQRKDTSRDNRLAYHMTEYSEFRYLGESECQSHENRYRHTIEEDMSAAKNFVRDNVRQTEEATEALTIKTNFDTPLISFSANTVANKIAMLATIIAMPENDVAHLPPLVLTGCAIQPLITVLSESSQAALSEIIFQGLYELQASYSVSQDNLLIKIILDPKGPLAAITPDPTRLIDYHIPFNQRHYTLPEAIWQTWYGGHFPLGLATKVVKTTIHYDPTNKRLRHIKTYTHVPDFSQEQSGQLRKWIKISCSGLGIHTPQSIARIAYLEKLANAGKQHLRKQAVLPIKTISLNLNSEKSSLTQACKEFDRAARLLKLLLANAFYDYTTLPGHPMQEWFLSENVLNSISKVQAQLDSYSGEAGILNGTFALTQDILNKILLQQQATLKSTQSILSISHLEQLWEDYKFVIDQYKNSSFPPVETNRDFPEKIEEADNIASRIFSEYNLKLQSLCQRQDNIIHCSNAQRQQLIKEIHEFIQEKYTPEEIRLIQSSHYFPMLKNQMELGGVTPRLLTTPDNNDSPQENSLGTQHDFDCQLMYRDKAETTTSFLHCENEHLSSLIFAKSKVTDNHLITTVNSAASLPPSITSDHYTLSQCKEIFFDGHPRVVCEGNQTTGVFTFHASKLINHALVDGNLLLGAVLLQMTHNIYNKVVGWFSGKTERAGIKEVQPTSKKAYEKSITKCQSKITKAKNLLLSLSKQFSSDAKKVKELQQLDNVLETFTVELEGLQKRDAHNGPSAEAFSELELDVDYFISETRKDFMKMQEDSCFLPKTNAADNTKPKAFCNNPQTFFNQTIYPVIIGKNQGELSTSVFQAHPLTVTPH